ncbi:hypothetical protein OGAPHI_000522 [Ogataea philodendri]|uniref:Uncharacterized protein n=1 Tax=Ogataea philodendri TaxID=1378263 RepID=A0A9P8TA72_9ASCO|nr:uncharacterized protein OGAPHI_000522 [Ogataea philodendri]KAH3671299.1 hypothetical protein OGAPHI_000522 [Ogataea philodendri]
MKAINISLALAGPLKEPEKSKVEVSVSSLPKVGMCDLPQNLLQTDGVFAVDSWVLVFKQRLIGAIDIRSEVTQLMAYCGYIYVLSGDTILVFTENTLELVDQVRLEFSAQRFWLLEIESCIVLVAQSCSMICVVTHNNTVTTSAPLYLPFWPKGAALLNRFYVYIVGPSGQYEVFRYNMEQQCFLPADRRMLVRIGTFGQPKLGRILDVEIVGQGKWVVLQETGWTLYQIQEAKLVQVVSSPLTNVGERLEKRKGEQYAFAIVMQNGELMVVEDGNVVLEQQQHPASIGNVQISYTDNIDNLVFESHDKFLVFESRYLTFHHCSLSISNFPIDVFFLLSESADTLTEHFLAYSVANFSFSLLAQLCMHCVAGRPLAFELLNQLLAGVGRFNEDLVHTWRQYADQTYFPGTENLSVYSVLVLGLLFNHEKIDLGPEFGGKLEKYSSCPSTSQCIAYLLNKLGPRIQDLARIPTLLFNMIEYNHLDVLDTFASLDERLTVTCLGLILSMSIPPLEYVNRLLITRNLAPNNLFILINALLMQLPCPNSAKTLNLLTTNFHESLGAFFEGVGERLPQDLLTSKSKVALMLDDTELQLGYDGVVMMRSRDKWALIPLKSEQLPPDNDLCSKLGQFQRLIKPKFAGDGSKLAVFDFSNYSIRIWDLSELKPDALDTRVVRSDIAVKLPNFYVLFLQRLGKAAPMEFASTNDTKVCYSNVLIDLSDLLSSYSEVFGFKCSDLDLDWALGDRIVLKLQNKIIFVYNLG